MPCTKIGGFLDKSMRSNIPDRFAITSPWHCMVDAELSLYAESSDTRAIEAAEIGVTEWRVVVARREVDEGCGGGDGGGGGGGKLGGGLKWNVPPKSGRIAVEGFGTNVTGVTQLKKYWLCCDWW